MSKIKPLFQLMRPTQWIKNGFVFMPLIFGGRLLSPDDAFKVLAMFISFCLASSATYILNDYADMERDRTHPVKKNRPLASGVVATSEALVAMLVLIAAAAGVAALAEAPFLCYVFVGAYLLLQVSYSFVFKNFVIVDVMIISLGFLLRVLVGVAVLGLSVSSWLVLCTFSVAILLTFGKRRHEMVILTDDAANHRPVLENYSVMLLDQFLQIATTSTFIFYCLYSVRGNPELGIESEKMTLTIPLVAYGIFRYLYLVHQKEEGGSPTTMLLTDPPLLICTLIWLASCVLIIYL